jgi:hypothetical protein
MNNDPKPDAREERTSHGSYRPSFLLYWTGRLIRPLIAEAMRQHNYAANQVMRRMMSSPINPQNINAPAATTPQPSHGQHE